VGSGPTGEAAVRRALADADIRPSKRLGQNFLVSQGVVDAVIDAIADESGSQSGAQDATWIEIGPGLGALTFPLAARARRLIAVEIDRRLAARLRNAAASSGTEVEIVEGDFLETDIRSFLAPDSQKLDVVGSIPYSITAPILKKLVESRDVIRVALLITQREVAEKVLASPGPDGTALGVFVRAYADVALVRRIPRGAFFPVPEVDSSLWKLTMLERPRFAASGEAFFAVVRAIYGARRKTLRNALQRAFEGVEVAALLAESGIDGTIRGETLGFPELDSLALAADMLEMRPRGAAEI